VEDPLGLGPPPWIVAHRGASADAPENTLEAFRMAVEQAADLIETDLQLTADGALAVFHDADLQRIAGSALVVEQEPLAPLRAAYPPLPDLDEILDRTPSGIPFNLELKRYGAAAEPLCEALARSLSRTSRPVLVSSFDRALLARSRALAPSLPLAVLERHDPAALLADAERLAAWSLHCHHELVTPSLGAAARRAGRPLLVYTVNEMEMARRLLDLGASGLFTDRPRALREELGLG
jgi:glycerophosphoryl diester phosphodiesterase